VTHYSHLAETGSDEVSSSKPEVDSDGAIGVWHSGVVSQSSAAWRQLIPMRRPRADWQSDGPFTSACPRTAVLDAHDNDVVATTGHTIVHSQELVRTRSISVSPEPETDGMRGVGTLSPGWHYYLTR
jgi:hypothetical protein